MQNSLGILATGVNGQLVGGASRSLGGGRRRSLGGGGGEEADGGKKKKEEDDDLDPSPAHFAQAVTIPVEAEKEIVLRPRLQFDPSKLLELQREHASEGEIFWPDCNSSLRFSAGHVEG